jgi:hypothetical protein
MRLRVIHLIDGQPVPSWDDQGPSRARIPGHYGSLVKGGPGPAESQRIAQRIYNQQRDKTQP